VEPDDEQGLAAVLGLFAALLVPMVLGPVREEVGQANVALLLGAVVVATGAAGGRRAGYATSVVAVLGFNFFHTVPYQSFNVEAGRDIVTLGLLFVAGFVASEVAHRSRVARRQAETSHLAITRLGALAGDLAAPRDASAIAHAAEALIARQLPGIEAAVEVPAGPDPITRLGHDGTIEPAPGSRVRTAVELHRGPVAVPITFGDESYGRIVVPPSSPPLDHDDWLTIGILADHVALALAGARSRG
jgi:hypothetical protein